MNEIQDWFISHRKNIIIVLVAVISLCASYLFGFYRGAHVSHQPERAGNVVQQLSEAQRTQSEITAGITDAEESADRIESGITEAESTVSRIDSNVNEAGDLIDQCQQIIERVQHRPAPDAAED